MRPGVNIDLFINTKLLLLLSSELDVFCAATGNTGD
jgi:hypothetical protein